MSEPMTEAGRVLLHEHSSGTPHMARHIIAIEAEACETALRERLERILADCGTQTESGNWNAHVAGDYILDDIGAALAP